MKNTTINQSRPILDKNGNVLFDYTFCEYALDKIDTYERENHKPAPLSPKFVEWLREGHEFVKSKKGTFTDYKERYILKDYANLYDQIIENTNRKNNELEKKGTFDARVVQTVKGVSDNK